MRIVLDLQGVQSESRFRGIGRYSLALAKEMARQAGDQELWVCLNAALSESIAGARDEFLDLIPRNRICVFNIARPVAESEPSNTPRARVSESIREAFLADLDPDIVHVSSLFEGWLDDTVTSIGEFAKHPTAVTLYDLIPLLNKQNYLGCDEAIRWYDRKISSLKRADVLLAISEYARQEAIEALSIGPDRIVNISSAVSEVFHPRRLSESARAALYAKYGIAGRYLLYSGAFESRKNVDRLVEAFSMMPPPLQQQYQLVMVGKIQAAERARLYALGEKLGIRNRVIQTGYISDEDLAMIYSYCDLFIFPSLHEGFGLPPLEAMACGAPAIGSNCTSIPEVIGRKDALFDPHHTTAITRKIVEVLTNSSFRRTLQEHAGRQARSFSWRETARRVLASFSGATAKGRDRKRWSVVRNEHDLRYKSLVAKIADLYVEHGDASDHNLATCATAILANRREAERVARTGAVPERMTWQIEGPFDSSYSLARLNRETALALEAIGHKVVLHSTEGYGDFEPSKEFLSTHPEIETLYRRAHEISADEIDIVSRNLYPPRVSEMGGKLNLLHHYAWEESGFPHEWVDDFNDNLQGITCLSRHVEKILIDHGVTVPLAVSGCGVDHWERIRPDRSYKVEARHFRFLHVSSCFPRKGVDVLLAAYGMAFSQDDNVSLIIKTFKNPHNNVHRWLAAAKADHPNFPHVVIIEDDLTDGELKSLYEQCDALVAPSLAEGFGLPLAEAALSGLAVITTRWGGQQEFCSDETAWLIDYVFEPARSHFDLFSSAWAVPKVDHLSNVMRQVFHASPSERLERVSRARSLLLSKFLWRDVASRLVASACSWSHEPLHTRPRMGWVSTWNTRCGIANYSRHLISKLPADVVVLAPFASEVTDEDHRNVIRCWNQGDDSSFSELSDNIEKLAIDTLIIQFNYGLFNFVALGDFLKRTVASGITVVIVLHSTVDPVDVLPHKRLRILRDALSGCDRLLVHTPADLNRLKALGLVDNVALFPHGIVDRRSSKPVPAGLPFVVGSYGFFLPHKGLLELIDAVALLRAGGMDVRLKMVNAEYPRPESTSLVRLARKRISNHHLQAYVEMFTDYLSDDDSLDLLSSCHVIAFPYQKTGESSSAAVRYGLAVGRPVAVTPLSIFDDVAPVVSYLPGVTATEIADGLSDMLQRVSNGGPEAQEKADRLRRWRLEHQYSRIARRLYGITVALRNRRGELIASPRENLDDGCSCGPKASLSTEAGMSEQNALQVIAKKKVWHPFDGANEICTRPPASSK